jgi:hypothetical protein
LNRDFVKIIKIFQDYFSQIPANPINLIKIMVQTFLIPNYFVSLQKIYDDRRAIHKYIHHCDWEFAFCIQFLLAGSAGIEK